MSFRELNVPGSRRMLVRLAALVAAASAVVATASLAGAAAPATATAFTQIRAYTPTITVPSTPGSTSGGALVPFIVRNVAFNVDFTTDAPLSTTHATTVSLAVTSGPDAGAVTASVSLPKDATTGSISGVVLPTAANGVTLQLTADTGVTGSTQVDVLSNYVPGSKSKSLNGIGGGGAAGVACTPSPTDPTCGDLMPPRKSSLAGDPLLSQGACTADCRSTSGSVLQALFTGVYSASDPVTFVAKCDKTLCPGKGVKSYNVKVQLTPGGAVTAPPPCPAKGVLATYPDGTTQPFCTDYVQSTRDGAGDVLLYVLFAQDAKIIW